MRAFPKPEDYFRYPIANIDLSYRCVSTTTQRPNYYRVLGEDLRRTSRVPLAFTGTFIKFHNPDYGSRQRLSLAFSVRPLLSCPRYNRLGLEIFDLDQYAGLCDVAIYGGLKTVRARG